MRACYATSVLKRSAGGGLGRAAIESHQRKLCWSGLRYCSDVGYGAHSWNKEVHEGYLRRAIDMAVDNVKVYGEGPFAAVIVDTSGNIVGESGNRVNLCKDPTAHAEVMAIRHACTTLQEVRLDHCVLYSSCEPCPMCLGAIYWANLSLVVYAADRENAENVGFMDKHLYDEIILPRDQRRIPFRRYLEEDGQIPFNTWCLDSSEERRFYCRSPSR
eukprot:gb/GECG01013819.1/.p1 GENE.gb/GECG01013819.1/~~gb/GECG01013819.1/.p1  ORF type:complete len:216 (+),score=14.47 gb/GECG01013819.1/:1-648(+)